MAITSTLVDVTPDWVLYLLEDDGSGAGSITNAALVANANLDGPIRRIVRAGIDGIGDVAAGAMTQAQARALFLGYDGPTALTSIGNNLVERAVTKLVANTGLALWAADANVDGGGNPILNVVSNAVLGATAYLYLKAAKSQAGEAAGAR